MKRIINWRKRIVAMTLAATAAFTAVGGAAASRTGTEGVTGVPVSYVSCFRDVYERDWYYEPVMAVARYGIVNGYEDRTFQPNAPVTRAEVSKMLAVALNLCSAEDAKPFTDVSGQWYAEYVALVSSAGIAGGYSDGSFRPENNITRGEAAKMLAVGLGLTSTEGAKSFTDVSDQWYAEYVALVSAAGIVGGYSNGSFQPENNITRAELSRMLASALNLKASDAVGHSWLGWSEQSSYTGQPTGNRMHYCIACHTYEIQPIPDDALDTEVLEAYAMSYAESLGFTLDYSLGLDGDVCGYFPETSSAFIGMDAAEDTMREKVNSLYKNLVAAELSRGNEGTVNGYRCNVVVTDRGDGTFSRIVYYG